MGWFHRRWIASVGLCAAGWLSSVAAAPLDAPAAAVGAALTSKVKPAPVSETSSTTHNGTSAVGTRAERVGNAEVLRVYARGSTYPVPGKILRYAERLLKKYDTNEDGVLQREEWEKMVGQPEQMDIDHDGVLALPELARYIARYGRAHRLNLMATLPQPAAGDATLDVPLFQPTAAKSALHSAPEAILPDEVAEMDEEGEEEEEEEVSPDGMPLEPSKAYPSGVQGKSWKKLRSARKFYVSPHTQQVVAPEWFRLRDLDGDSQLTLAEYAPHATQTELLEFARYDLDRDGVITLKEVARFGGVGTSRTAASGTAATGAGATAVSAAADPSRLSPYSKSARGYGSTTAAGVPAVTGYTRSSAVDGSRAYPRTKTPNSTIYGGTR